MLRLYAEVEGWPVEAVLVERDHVFVMADVVVARQEHASRERQDRVLGVMTVVPRITAQGLAIWLGLATQTVSADLHSLERRGLVERHQAENPGWRARWEWSRKTECSTARA